MNQITIIGAGAYGVALAQTLSQHNHVTVWGRNREKICRYDKTKIHDAFPESLLSHSIHWSSDLQQSLSRAKYVFLTIPTQQTREVMQQIAPFVDSDVQLIQTAKGIEIHTSAFVYQITQDIFPSHAHYVLSGPGFASDIVSGKPTALVVAGKEDTKNVKNLFKHTIIRPYGQKDIQGVCLGGALKNILAIAAGFCIGLGLGEGAKAVIITRGFNEMLRFATIFNVDTQTLYGLSGLGDLILTANSSSSRNYQYGYQLAKHQEKLCASQTVEGIHTLYALNKISLINDNDFPIFSALIHLAQKTKKPTEIIKDLLYRPLRHEF